MKLILVGAAASFLRETVEYVVAFRENGHDWPDRNRQVLLAIAVNVALAALAVFLASAIDAISNPTGAVIVGFSFPASVFTFFGGRTIERSPGRTALRGNTGFSEVNRLNGARGVQPRDSSSPEPPRRRVNEPTELGGYSDEENAQ